MSYPTKYASTVSIPLPCTDDKAAAIAHKALDENTTLREAAIATGFITADEFDKVVIPANMVGNPHQDLNTMCRE